MLEDKSKEFHEKFKLEDNSKERMLICQQCQEFDNDRCKLCGCYMPLKTKIKFMHCPAKKW